MKSIDELREYGRTYSDVSEDAILMHAEAIDAEIKRDCMRLPRDRDGEVIRICDEVWFHDDEIGADPHVVRGYGMTNGRDVDVLLNRADEGWCPNTVAVPDALVHRITDPLEELLERHEDECLAIRIEASDTQAKESVWRKALDDKHAEYAERIRELMEEGE